MLETGATDKNIALIEAASYNQIEIVEYLLKRSANINTAGYGGQTALHNAAGNKKKFFLKKYFFFTNNFICVVIFCVSLFYFIKETRKSQKYY